MKKKLLVAGLFGVVTLLLGAVAVEQMVVEPRIISSWSDLYSEFNARSTTPPLPDMEPETIYKMVQNNDFSFMTNKNWSRIESGGIYYVSKDSKELQGLDLPLTIRVYEYLPTDGIYVLSSKDGANFKSETAFAAEPLTDETFKAMSLDEQRTHLLFELWRKRAIWEITLKSESEKWTDLLKVEEASSLLFSDENATTMMLLLGIPPPEHTNDIWISGAAVSNGFDLAVYCPSGVSNVEIYVSDDLVSNVWTVAVSDLSAVNTNTVYWTASAEEDTGFFRAGNLDVDSDEDGLPDAREIFVFKTEVNDPDSDGDGYSDGPIWPSGYTNVMRGTNDLFPNDPSAWRDTDGDGLPNEVVGTSSSTPPLIEDLDDDGDGTNDFLFSSIWISASEISGLATNTAQWTNLWEDANKTSAVDISDQDNNANVYTMAKALVYARTGIESYRTAVIDACMDAIGTETGGRTLALGRNLGAFVIAAELVGLPWAEEMQFRDWLKEVRIEQMTEGTNLVWTHENRPNNWGTMAGGSRAAVAVYLQDWDDLARAAQVFKGYLGDRNSYSNFVYSRGVAWQSDTNNPVGINPQGATLSYTTNGTTYVYNVDGVLPDDQRRSASNDIDFVWNTTNSPPWNPTNVPPTGEEYVYEALQGVLLQAVILNRAGYDTWEWENRAILRAYRWMHDLAGFDPEDGYPPNDDGDDTWQPFIINYYYEGTNLLTRTTSNHGKNMAPTCWTHQIIP